MCKKIRKHLKVSYSCKNCNTTFINRIIVGVKKQFSVKHLDFSVLNYPDRIKVCRSCHGSDFNISYTYYHHQTIKIKKTAIHVH
jgi:hypothetical protein